MKIFGIASISVVAVMLSGCASAPYELAENTKPIGSLCAVEARALAEVQAMRENDDSLPSLRAIAQSRRETYLLCLGQEWGRSQ